MSLRLVLLLPVALAACAAGEIAPPPAPAPAAPTLIGPEWRLVEFRSSSDEVGVVRPGLGELYSLRFQPGGRVTARLYCNRGTGRYTAADPSAARGSISLGMMAMTRAACPPTPLDRLPGDLGNVVSYVIEGGRLHLNLKLDAGDYVWEPAAERTVRYRCGNGPALVVAFAGETARIVEGNGAGAELRQRPAASGFWYETGPRSLRGKGDEITYTVGRMAPIVCQAER